ncbi:uncharacterized protein SAPINGB_P001327 [Magnusiomyces paraingens]|uniref:Glutamine amidotransferase domain-containing protein n=1 Tax=Magnusiomyces paraingens TaxID=2606893 RepID=A0A5E8B5P9_9ASCO|nr:uncharacterized protein SAPINGB_P001327 [Saprochaete ingens]VVT46667.1 unnamed protein product [Saprochaete ingens]
MTKIAIIEPDTPTDKVYEAYGTYGNIFSRLLEIGGIDLGSTERPATIKSYNIVENPTNYPSLDVDSPERPDVILITGSRFNAYDDTDWIVALVEFARKCLFEQPADKPIRVIGICYGHQIIGRVLGSKVGPNPKGWEVSSTKITLSDKGKEIFSEFAEAGYFNIMEMHRDIVFDIPPNAGEDVYILGSTDVCEIQGLYKPKTFLSLQGHPEFDKFIEEELLVDRHKKGLFTDEFVADGLARAGDTNDGNTLAKAMVRFIYE